MTDRNAAISSQHRHGSDQLCWRGPGNHSLACQREMESPMAEEFSLFAISWYWLAHFWSKLAQIWSKDAQIWSKLAHIWSKDAQIWSKHFHFKISQIPTLLEVQLRSVGCHRSIFDALIEILPYFWYSFPFLPRVRGNAADGVLFFKTNIFLKNWS